jgi:DNA polymerase III subunit gamma/tau
MTYEALALRYRPKVIDELIGQPAVVKSLRGMTTSGRISRSLLIHGPWGSGKTTIARMIARYVNCENRKPEEDPCGECDSCKLMDDLIHPDLVELNAADTRGIDTVRELIEQAQFSPRYSYRCYVLDECHMLTDQAKQALLKLLEEPPSRTIIMLATTDPGKLPFTIKSRCVQLKLKHITPEVTAEHLENICKKEEFDAPPEVLLAVARAVSGHPRDALSALEQIIHYSTTEGLPSEEQLEEMIPQIIEEVVGIPPEIQVQKYLKAVLLGKASLAIRMIRGVSNVDMFFQQSINLLQQIIFKNISHKLADQYYDKFYKSLDAGLAKAEKDLDHDRMLSLLELHMNSLERAKQYLISADDVLILVALKGCQIEAAVEYED